MAAYLGDFVEDSTHYFLWDTNDADGASITRATDGTIQIWKEGDQSTATVAGITDNENEGGVTGVHRCTMVLTDAAYAKAKDYSVVLVTATIDGEVVNAVLAEFSIENRFAETDMTAISGDSTAADNLEAILDGSGGTGLTLNKLTINGNTADGTIDIDNAGGPGVAIGGTTFGMELTASNGPGLSAVSSGGNGAGIIATANGSGDGILATGGAEGHGLHAIGGATSGTGVYAIGPTSGHGFHARSYGTGKHGIYAQVSGDIGTGIVGMGKGTGEGIAGLGGATGHGVEFQGGATSGHGMNIFATTDGHGMSIVAAGDNSGIIATKAGTGYDIDADIHGNLSGSVGSSTATDALLGTPVDIDGGGATIADNLKKICDDNGGGTFDATTDSLTELHTAVAAGFPENNTADADPGGGAWVITGTQTANDSDSTFLNDGTYWQIAAAAADGDGFGLRADQTFTLGITKKISALRVNANETLGGVVHVWAKNYVTTNWDQLSDADTAISGSADNDYTYALLPVHQQAGDGEVQVRYTSTETTTNKYLYLDQVLLETVTAGNTLAEIANAVWHYILGNPDELTAAYALDKTRALVTDVATGDTTTSFTLTAGKASDNAHCGQVIMVEDETDHNYETRRIVSYTSGRVVTVDRAFSFTPATGDHVYLQAAGYADVNTTHISGTAQTANDNGADINLILADTGELQTNQGAWITATGFATPANVTDAHSTTDGKVDALVTTVGVAGAGLTAIDLPDQTMDITGNLSGSVGSVTGAVGSVAGNVDGSVASVVGAVGSVTGAVGSVTGAVGSVAGNVDGSVASVVGAVGSVTGAVGSVAATVTTDAASRTASKATGFSTPTNVTDAHSTTDGKIDTVDTVVDAILVDTGTTLPASIAAIPTAVQNADALLIRDVSNTEDAAGSHSITAVVLAILESAISDTTWTIRKTGGDTFATKTVTVDANADPITGVT